jgi:hypothetical protein
MDAWSLAQVVMVLSRCLFDNTDTNRKGLSRVIGGRKSFVFNSHVCMYSVISRDGREAFFALICLLSCTIIFLGILGMVCGGGTCV